MMHNNWKTIPPAGIITTPGSSTQYHTGSWKSKKPVVDEQKCIHCLLCCASCPDNCFAVVADKRQAPALEFCKGCGICSQVCPTKAITMENP